MFLKHLISEEDLAIQETFRKFTEKEIIPRREELDITETNEPVILEIFGKLKDIGAQKLFVPEEYGGGGCSSRVAIPLMVMEMAKGDAGLALSTTINNVSPWLPINVGRNKVLMDIVAPMWCSDELMSYGWCFTEPSSGNDISIPGMEGRAMKVTARLDGDEWVINGQKVWPSNAGRKGFLGVYCTTGPELGKDGIACIFVPVPSKGVTFGKPEDKLGCRGCLNASVYFDNVRVPKEYRCGGPGVDANIMYGACSTGIFGLGAMAIGVAEAAFDYVLEYTGERIVAGKPARQHSMVASILADMAIKIETAKSTCLSVGIMLNNLDKYGPPWSPSMYSKICISRIHACEMAVWVTNKAIELMGAYGISTEYPMEKYLREARTLSIPLGGMQTNRYEVIAGYYDFDFNS